MLLVNMLEGRFISEYDDEIATRIATVLCGGEVDRGAVVDEEWLLRLERKHFVELAQQEKTQARIGHMLKTGKPPRNRQEERPVGNMGVSTCRSRWSRTNQKKKQ